MEFWLPEMMARVERCERVIFSFASSKEQASRIGWMDMLPRSGMSPFGGVFDGNYQVRMLKVHLMENPLIWCDLR